jgi:exonuclease III
VKSWKKIYQVNGPPKQSGVAILMSHKIDFKMTVKKDKEGHFIVIKVAKHQEEITIINLYAPSFIKHILKDLKSHIDPNTVVVRDFYTYHQ